jgi:hypothetical protein
MQQRSTLLLNSIGGDPYEVSPTSSVGVFMEILFRKIVKKINTKPKGFLVIITNTKTNPFTEFDLN